MRFEFATANQIIFGAGRLPEIGPVARGYGSRALIATNLAPEQAASLVEVLDTHGLTGTIFQIHNEPTIEVVNQGKNLSLAEGCELVIGFGGGSAIDCAKAVAALTTNPGEVIDYLEVIGAGRPLVQPPLPCLAVPTTAGTGAEVTRNAVLSSLAQQVKVSLRSPLMLPRLALVDPELTYRLPPALTASTGMDALTQLIEPYTCNRPNPVTDTLCVDGIRRAGHALLTAYENGDDPLAREEMSLASLFGGLALANARLGAVHGFAGVLGGMYAAPHGAICARLLPFVMEVNLRALQARSPLDPNIRRYEEVARVLTGSPQAQAVDGVAWVIEAGRRMNIPPMAAYGVSRSDLPGIIEKSAQASSMKGNPILLSFQEMEEILERAL